MRVRWTEPAAGDLTRIVERIREENPAASQRIARMIYQSIAALGTMPNRGRIGTVAGTRELVFSPLPYIAVYQIIEDQLQVLRIRHAAQDWP